MYVPYVGHIFSYPIYVTCQNESNIFHSSTHDSVHRHWMAVFGTRSRCRFPGSRRFLRHTTKRQSHAQHHNHRENGEWWITGLQSPTLNSVRPISQVVLPHSRQFHHFWEDKMFQIDFYCSEQQTTTEFRCSMPKFFTFMTTNDTWNEWTQFEISLNGLRRSVISLKCRET